MTLSIEQFCDKFKACREGREWALLNCKDMSVDAASMHPIVIASVDGHRERCNKDGFSKWYVTIDGKRRRIELQEYNGRLYLVGCLFSGLLKVLEFEESLDSITRKFGRVRSR